MITALAIMIAVAGYLNFAGNKIGEETLVVSDEMLTDDEMTALLDLSEEDIVSDIESLDQDAVHTDNYLTDNSENEGLFSEVSVDMSGNPEEGEEDVVNVDSDTVLTNEQDEVIEGTPGEAVFTSTRAVSTLSAAKVLKEQTRSKNKEALAEIVNNDVLASEQKKEAVDSMVALAEKSEKEMEAEILLSAKGFPESVVSMGGSQVDVIICADTLSDAQLAQIMDIVSRKTGEKAENIIISQVTQK